VLIVIGEAEVAPGRGEELRQAATAIAASTRSDEGCQSYGFYVDLSRPEVIVSVELWRDGAALEAHLDHDHTARFLAAVPQLVVGTPTMRFFEAEPVTEGAR
jgi:quinol monooxygenase YgiN